MMDEKTIIELTKSTVDEVDRILRLSNSDYIKEFGCEADRTDKAKIERAVTMVASLHFFIDRYYEEHASKTATKVALVEEKVPVEAPEPEVESASEKPKPVGKKKG